MVLLWFLVRLPAIQNRLLPTVTYELSKVLGTEVTADKIDLEFFTNLSLQNTLIKDSKNDTLVFAGELDVDISLFSFFEKTLLIDDISIKNAVFNFEKQEGISNYQHIVDHLSTDSETDRNDGDNSWDIDISSLELKDVSLTQKGDNTLLSINVPYLKSDITDFDTSFETLHFTSVDSKDMEIRYAEYKQGVSNDSPTEFPSLPISIQVDNLDFRNGKLTYDREYEERKEQYLDGNHLSFTNLNLTSKDFRWGKSISGDITSLSFEEQSGLDLRDLSTVVYLDPQSIGFQDLIINTKNSSVDIDLETKFKDFDQLVNDFTQIEMELDVNEFNLKTSDIEKIIDIKTISAINLSSVDEIKYSGKVLSQNGKYFAERSKLKIDNKLNADGSFLYNTKNQNYTAELSYLNTNDRALKILFPSIKFPDDVENLGSIRGSGTVYGGPDNTNFENLNLLLGGKNIIAGSGKVSDFKNAKGPQLNLNLSNLEIEVASIFKKGGAIPDQLFKLGKVKFQGNYEGNLYDINVDGNIITDLGNSNLDMKINFNDDYSNAIYDGEFDIENLDIGKLLNDEKYGITTGSGAISGSGLTLENLDANMDVKIKETSYDGKAYKDITVDGSYKDDLFNGKFASTDEKLNINFEGKAAIMGDETKVNFTTQIEKYDLTQYGIGDSIFWISGLYSGDLEGSTIDNIIGVGQIQNLKIGTLNGVYLADSTIAFTSILNSNNTKEYRIHSPFLEGKILGNIKLSELPHIIEAYIKEYIPVESGYDLDETRDSVSIDNQSFIVDLKVKDIDPLLEILVGDNLKLNNARLGGIFSSEDSRIDLKGSIENLFYKGYTIRKTNYFFDGRKDFINGNVIFNEISDDDNMVIDEAIITTSLNNKVADLNLEIYDAKGDESLFIGGNLSRSEEYIFSFHDTLRMNQDTWTFTKENRISYGEEGLYMQLVEIKKDNQNITVYTDENDNGQAIEVIFNDFIISELASIIGQENEYLEGSINGTVLINSIWDNPFLTADASINDILVSSKNIGTITIQAEQDSKANLVKSKIQLNGQENGAALDLNYNIITHGINGLLKMDNLSMTALDPFLTNVIKDSNGFLNGKVEIGGNIDSPDLNGKVYLKSVETTPIFTNSKVRINDNSIDIRNTVFEFGELVLLDEDENQAKVTGNVTHNKLSDINLNLNLTTDKFHFLNTTQVENKQFYGDIKVKAKVSVTGLIDNVKIDGSAEAIDLSHLTLSPFSSEQYDFDNDYIVFADPRSINSDSLKLKQLSKQNTYPFDLDIKLTVKDDSKFEMIMDPKTGDKIEAFGNADFIFRLTQAGDILLFGNYVVSKGNYFFSYTPVIKKTFKIQEGGSVSFNGDPLNATMDVSAVYIANTAVYDLLKLETSSLSQSQISEAQRKRDMNVVLYLNKSIISPEIRLDIENQEEDISSISNELNNKLEQLRNNPDELNNQVFGLLVFDNFILASNSETNLTQTGADIAIKSISGLVTKKLNNLADGLIPGFDLDFGVNSYSSSYLSDGKGGLITELGAKASKNFFNDRLIVTAGTNINLESTTSNSVFNTIVGDFILQYKLNEKGSYRLKAFRKSSFDRILDENSSKTGVSIFANKEFGEIKKKN